MSTPIHDKITAIFGQIKATAKYNGISQEIKDEHQLAIKFVKEQLEKLEPEELQSKPTFQEDLSKAEAELQLALDLYTKSVDSGNNKMKTAINQLLNLVNQIAKDTTLRAKMETEERPIIQKTPKQLYMNTNNIYDAENWLYKSGEVLRRFYWVTQNDKMGSPNKFRLKKTKKLNGPSDRSGSTRPSKSGNCAQVVEPEKIEFSIFEYPNPDGDYKRPPIRQITHVNPHATAAAILDALKLVIGGDPELEEISANIKSSENKIASLKKQIAKIDDEIQAKEAESLSSVYTANTNSESNSNAVYGPSAKPKSRIRSLSRFKSKKKKQKSPVTIGQEIMKLRAERAKLEKQITEETSKLETHKSDLNAAKKTKGHPVKTPTSNGPDSGPDSGPAATDSSHAVSTGSVTASSHAAALRAQLPLSNTSNEEATGVAVPKTRSESSTLQTRPHTAGLSPSSKPTSTGFHRPGDIVQKAKEVAVPKTRSESSTLQTRPRTVGLSPSSKSISTGFHRLRDLLPKKTPQNESEV